MKLTPEMVNQINDPQKLQYLLNGMIKKNEARSQQIKELQAEVAAAKSSDIKEQMLSISPFLFDYQNALGEFGKSVDPSFYPQISKLVEQTNQIISRISALGSPNASGESRQRSPPASVDYEKVISEKDSAITKWKSMLQRSVKSEKRQHQQIADLQAENQLLQGRLSEQQKPSSSAPIEVIASLEKKVADLERQISMSAPSKELEQKNDRLSAMLDTSNRLYTQLKESYQQLQNSSSQRIGRIILESSEAIGFEIPKCTRKPLSSDLVSLRKTLLQFLLADESSQISLIPVILDLVGCSHEQIDAIMLKQKSKQQWINQTNGFFGLFG